MRLLQKNIFFLFRFKTISLINHRKVYYILKSTYIIKFWSNAGLHLEYELGTKMLDFQCGWLQLPTLLFIFNDQVRSVLVIKSPNYVKCVFCKLQNHIVSNSIFALLTLINTVKKFTQKFDIHGLFHINKIDAEENTFIFLLNIWWGVTSREDSKQWKVFFTHMCWSIKTVTIQTWNSLFCFDEFFF